ncbi:MAG TPA: hypothetical protein VGR28_11060 [Candidatus Thermoplasmatota archaeon]|nr:hypothetical protein [Candidatus Thermoplasmatota archaeon]
MQDLLTLDPTGARARLLLAARAAPVGVGALVASLLGYVVLLPLAPAYGGLGDAAAMVLALALLALAAGSAELTFEAAPRLTSALATLGACAALAAAALSAASIAGAGRVAIQGTGIAFSAAGLWLIAWNGLAWARGALPRATAGLGLLAGVGFVAGAAAGDPSGSGMVAAAMAGALAVVGFPPWALGLRRALLRAAGVPAGRAAGGGVNA